MAMNHSVGELEERAAHERERVRRDVGEVRHDLRREMDVRGRVEDRIRSKPGAAYGTAAGAAALAGYVIARVLKT